MSKYTESVKELESIQETEEYENFAKIVENISNLGVATAVLGGFLRAWCQANDEDFTHALALMVFAHKEVKRSNNDS